MRDKIKGIFIGLAISTLLTGATAAAAGTNINVMIKKLNMYVDGTKKTSANSIVYNGTTYVPIRSTAEAIGKPVSLHDNNLYIGKQPKALTEDQAFDTLYKKIKKDADLYQLHFMLEEETSESYSIRAFEDMDTHIATYGFYTVYKYDGKITKLDIASGSEIEI